MVDRPTQFVSCISERKGVQIRKLVSKNSYISNSLRGFIRTAGVIPAYGMPLSDTVNEVCNYQYAFLAQLEDRMRYKSNKKFLCKINGLLKRNLMRYTTIHDICITDTF